MIVVDDRPRAEIGRAPQSRAWTIIGIAIALGLIVWSIVAASPATDPADAATRTTMSWYDTPGHPIGCGTGTIPPSSTRQLWVAMRPESGVRCGQRIVLCVVESGRCVWVRRLDSGPYANTARRGIDAPASLLRRLGLDPVAGLYEVTWRAVPTTAVRGCRFPAWVGRAYSPRCER